MNFNCRTLNRAPAKSLMRGLLLTVSLVAISAGAQPATKLGYAPDRVLVRFKPGAAASGRAQARSEALAKRSESIRIVPGLEILTLDARASVTNTIEVLGRNPNVEYAEPDYSVHADMVPNDPEYSIQWALSNIKAERAWDSGAQNGSQVAVAVIDTGIDMNHPDLQTNIWNNPGEIPGDGVDNDVNGYVDDVNGWDFVNGDNDPFDDNGHGTHVAGTISATGNNAQGVAGVMWQARLVPLKFLDANGSGWTSDAIWAVQYATQKGIKVSNNSWGGGGYSQSLYDAISASKSIGHIFVAAAGNSAVDTDFAPQYPSGYDLDNIVSVASIAEGDSMSWFSNYGATTVDLGAPGSSIYSTLPGNQYGSLSGTSMATPHVAGAVAMLYSLQPTHTYEMVRNQILASVRPLAALVGKTVSGGTLDLYAAITGNLTPSNDNRDQALDVGEGQYAGTLALATPDGTSSCPGNGQADIWYRFTAPVAGVLRTDTCGTSDLGGVDAGTDTVLSLHSGDGLTELGCNDDWHLSGVPSCPSGPDAGAPRDSNVRLSVVPDQQVLIRVTKYSSYDAAKNILLNVTFDADSDQDGIMDNSDNCSLVPNPTQLDSDGDGYGNLCDGDLNNNGFTNAQDYVLLRAQLGRPSVGPAYNPADLNGNGFVNAQDAVLFRQLLGQPSGPSGVVR